MMKRLYFIIVSAVILFSFSPVLAAGNQTKVPTKLTYAKEWLNLNLLTWKTQSKVTLLNRYAGDRANQINFIANQNNSSVLAELAERYSGLIAKANKIAGKHKDNASTLTDLTKSSVLSQQKILSEARQKALIEDDQKVIAAVQTETVNVVKQSIADFQNTDRAKEFTDQTVTVWRDPKGAVKDEKATRVYAAGTTESGNVNDGVLIDQGEAKISQDTSGNLKIEYAPGTGPTSTATDNGKKLWKILQSDGTTVESYTAGGKVVIGGSSGTATNVIVNTVNGGTATSAQTVVGGGTGTAGVVVVGGLPTVKTGQVGQESSPAADPGQTIINSTNSINGANELNSTGGTSGAGQVIQTAPAGQN